MNLMNGKMNLAVCISGGGSTMQEVLNATRDGRLNRVNPSLIISSNETAAGIKKALEFGMRQEDVLVIKKNDFKTEIGFGSEILAQCDRRNIDLIAMCGWLPLMPTGVIDAYRDYIFNQHPGPLDNPNRLGFGGCKMHGTAVHHAVLYFAKHINRPFATCATVHMANEKYDEGKIIDMLPVEILPDDTAETLAARVLPKEHELVTQTIFKFAEFGQIHELQRLHPLIHDGEESILSAAKADAVRAFPKG